MSSSGGFQLPAEKKVFRSLFGVPKRPWHHCGNLTPFPRLFQSASAPPERVLPAWELVRAGYFECGKKKGDEGHRMSLTLRCSVKPPLNRRVGENMGAEKRGVTFFAKAAFGLILLLLPSLIFLA